MNSWPWITQLKVIPHKDGTFVNEHEVPYEVQYNAETGERRTIVIKEDGVKDDS